MSFKFTLLGLERIKDNCDCDCNQKEYKPRKSSNSKKSINHRKKFTKAVQKCHRETKDKNAFGRCMSKELKK